jgi:hypothetical protein
MTRIKDACSGEFPHYMDSLLSILKETHQELSEVRKGISKISNVGSRIAAGSFNQGIEDLHRLIWESTAAKTIHPTLELCKASLTHLFGDDARIKKALEAAKFKPYQATPYRPKSSSHPRSSDAQEGKDWKKTRSPTSPTTVLGPREKAKALPPRRGRARKRCESFKGGRGGGPGLSVPSPDASPCHVSLSIFPRPTTIWRSGADCATSFCSGRRCWIPPLIFSKPWKATIRHRFLPGSRILNSIARSEQPPYRHRGGSSNQEGGHRRGAAASSSSQLHQQHFFSAEKE